MCHGHIDPKYLMQDAQARTQGIRAPSLHLVPAIKGVWARVRGHKTDHEGSDAPVIPAE